jgi:hypothetical protein
VFFGLRRRFGAKETANLPAFYDSLEAEYGLPEMMAVTDDMLARYYPGLEEIDLLQSVVKIPEISSAVNEYVFLQCASPEDAAAAEKILQARIDGQAAGGAWYPATVKAWKTAQVAVHGNYVAMIAAGEDTEKIVSEWNALFAA